MYEPFKRKGMNYVTSIDRIVADVLLSLLEDVAALLERDMPDLSDPLVAMTGISSDAATPSDARVARLLPAGTSDSADVAAEYRRFTDLSLRQAKVTNLRTAADTLRNAPTKEGTLLSRRDDSAVVLVLSAGEAQAWLTAIADSRLVLAEELGIKNQQDAERCERELEALSDNATETTQRDQQVVVYELLAELQYSLIKVLSKEL